MTETIQIKKDTLWKGATFVLALVVVGLLIFGGNGAPTTGNVVANPGAGAGTAPVDLSVFIDNPSLYPSIGPEDAENIVIEFSDFQCPFCAMAAGLASWTEGYKTQYGDLIESATKIQDLAKEGKLRFIYVPMSFLGEESVWAAEAAYCAHDQGKFWEMHDAIFTAHDSTENQGQYSKDKLKVIAQGLDLDMAKFNKCLDNSDHASDVSTAGAQASAAASGTPTFYVNGQKLSGSWTQLSTALGL